MRVARLTSGEGGIELIDGAASPISSMLAIRGGEESVLEVIGGDPMGGIWGAIEET